MITYQQQTLGYHYGFWPHACGASYTRIRHGRDPTPVDVFLLARCGCLSSRLRGCSCVSLSLRRGASADSVPLLLPTGKSLDMCLLPSFTIHGTVSSFISSTICSFVKKMTL